MLSDGLPPSRPEAARARLEPARSARSRCRTCGGGIALNEIRVSLGPAPGGEGFHHVVCAATRWPRAMLERVPEPDARMRERVDWNRRSRVDLPALAEAAQQGRWEVVADGLRQGWWSTHHTRMATLLSDLTRTEIDRMGGLPVGPGLYDLLAELDMEDPLQRGIAIAATPRHPKSHMADVLASAFSMPPDPRWLDVLLPWFADPPFRSAPVVWWRALELMDWLAGPILQEATAPERIPRADFWRAGLPWELPEWLQRRDAPWFAERMVGTLELLPGDAEALDVITDLIARRGADARRGEGALQALYAEALVRSDARAILADRFVERGDPRGEFLQLADMQGREARHRAKELRRTQWRELVGGLAPIALGRGLVFEGGLPVEIVVRARRGVDYRTISAVMEWGSIRSLELAPSPGGHESALALLPVAAPSLKRIVATVYVGRAYGLLFGGPTLPGVEVVEIPGPRWGADSEISAEETCRFPSLKHLVVPAGWPRNVLSDLRERLPGVIVAHRRPRE